MDGLPFIPGFRLNDITKRDYNLTAQFRWKNGYAVPIDKPTGIGKAPLDVESILYNKSSNTVGYNPELTYGKTKDPPTPVVHSHFTLFDGKCLSFRGYTKQTVVESPLDTFRVRQVKITYFLVDDTFSIVEPVVENAGYVQGCLLKRCHVPSTRRKNRNWHWSDLNNGVELDFFGIVYRLCSCDQYTKQFLSSQGIVMGPDEPMPNDPYMVVRWQRKRLTTHSDAACNDQSGVNDKLKQFLEYDGKVLRFYTAWDDNGAVPEEWKFFTLLYFMADDRIEIVESKDVGQRCDKNPFPVFLRKIKLPKNWLSLPLNFPLIYLEPGSKEYREYYEPKDFIIGNTIFVMGRRFFLYDCDAFTRDYFKQILHIDQPDPIRVLEPKDDFPVARKKVIPPYTGFGDPNDTRQNCLSLIPKPAKTLDFVTYVLNATKKLRYKLKMIPVYDVDEFRDFIMEFCLGNDQMSVTEVVGKNSGFVKGRFMSSIRLRKPGTNVDDDDFYGTKDFAIGAELYIKGRIFKIVELDLWTYNYMNENKDMFTQDAIDGAKSFLENKGLLKALQENEQKDINKDNADQNETIKEDAVANEKEN